MKAVVFHTSSLIHPKGILEVFFFYKKKKLISIQQCNFVFVFAKCIENVSRQDCPICLEVSYFAFGSGKYVGLCCRLCWNLMFSFFCLILVSKQDIHTSRVEARVLPCGHLLHK